jgi:cyclophilin family peptidyl-prolyl cis-trans isomerase
MANCGEDTNGSKFFITTGPCPWLYGKYVFFGEVIAGFDLVEKIEACCTSNGTPRKKVFFVDCRQLK